MLLPARAGMIPYDVLFSEQNTAAPRTRGDDPNRFCRSANRSICSPHARG